MPVVAMVHAGIMRDQCLKLLCACLPVFAVAGLLAVQHAMRSLLERNLRKATWTGAENEDESSITLFVLFQVVHGIRALTTR